MSAKMQNEGTVKAKVR